LKNRRHLCCRRDEEGLIHPRVNPWSSVCDRIKIQFIDFLESSGVDSSGNKLQRTPDNPFNVGFDWTFGSGSLADSLNFNANYSWQDRLFWLPANTHWEDSYGLWNARFSYAPPGSAWSVSAWIKNGSDELHSTNASAIWGDEFSLFAAPRTYGVDLRVGF